MSAKGLHLWKQRLREIKGFLCRHKAEVLWIHQSSYSFYIPWEPITPCTESGTQVRCLWFGILTYNSFGLYPLDEHLLCARRDCMWFEGIQMMMIAVVVLAYIFYCFRARHYSEHFTYMNLLKQDQDIVSLFLFSRWGNWDRSRWNNLPKDLLVISDKATKTQGVWYPDSSQLSNVYSICLLIW